MSETNLSGRAQFERHFSEWVKAFQPEGDTSALQAIAWFWYSAGNDCAVDQVGEKLREFQREVFEGLITEYRRFNLGLSSNTK